MDSAVKNGQSMQVCRMNGWTDGRTDRQDRHLDRQTQKVHLKTMQGTMQESAVKKY